MKLNEFISKNCCNYVTGSCIGVLGNSRFNNTNICHLINKEELLPCNYFEKVVLPYAIKLGCHEELVNSYSQVDSGVIKRTKEVRDKESKKYKKMKKTVKC